MSKSREQSTVFIVVFGPSVAGSREENTESSAVFGRIVAGSREQTTTSSSVFSFWPTRGHFSRAVLSSQSSFWSTCGLLLCADYSLRVTLVQCVASSKEQSTIYRAVFSLSLVGSRMQNRVFFSACGQFSSAVYSLESSLWSECGWFLRAD